MVEKMMALENSTATTTALQLVLRTPSPRLMRRTGQTHDKYTVNGKQRTRELNAGETSLDWKPKLLPLFSFPRGSAVQAGSAMGIYREGYEGEPLGIVTDTYRPVNHHDTISEVAASTEGRATLEGSLIDGHGYHVVHAFRLASPATEDNISGLPLVSRLTIVHDHTGTGSLRASVVCYLGNSIVVGSACFTRRIHVGNGDKDVGVGNKTLWLGVIDAMLDTATLQQNFIVSLLKKAAETKLTEAVAEVFEKHDVTVERERVTAAEKKEAADRGDPEPVGAFIAQTALDVVIQHHKVRKGQLGWGVWSRRLEGDALAALEVITDITIPKQLFRKS